MLSFYPFSTHLMHSLPYVGQTVRSESILFVLLFKNHFRIILNSKSQNFKNHKAQIKFINSYTKRVSMALNAASGRKERADRSFNYCCSKSRWFWKWLKYDLIFAWLFSYKDSNFWYFSWICKVFNFSKNEGWTNN